MPSVKAIAICTFLIALYFLSYYFYQGILNPIPAPGDSFDYHIPIEKSILNGTFLTAKNFTQYRWFYPGSTEAINSIFIYLHIPLTLSNFIATIALFFVCIKLGFVFLKDKYYSLLFASSIVSLNAIVRWLNAVSIDIWLTVFFLMLIIALEKPQKTILYFIKLGFLAGMIVGSKYSAVLFLIPLAAIYFKNIISKINIIRTGAFIASFSVFGLFWYIRNFIATQNPFYPLQIFGFKGHGLFDANVLSVSTKYPPLMLNAFFSEYKLWILSIIFAFIFIIYRIYKKNLDLDLKTKLFIIGVVNFIIYFSFPTSAQPWIMVSSLRYSYPFFIPLILGVFLLFMENKRKDALGIFALANALPVLSMVFYPKLVLFYIPIGVVFLYFFEKYRFKQ